MPHRSIQSDRNLQKIITPNPDVSQNFRSTDIKVPTTLVFTSFTEKTSYNTKTFIQVKIVPKFFTHFIFRTTHA